MTALAGALRAVVETVPGITFLPDLVLAGLYLAAWIRPDLVPREVLGLLMPLLLVEFVLIHSTALMGGMAWAGADQPRARIGGVLLGGVYLGFVFLLTAGMRSSLLFVPVAWQLVSKSLRFLAPLPHLGERQLGFAVAGWFGSAIVYCIAIGLGLTLVLPELGSGGIGTRALGVRGDSPFDAPQRVLAAGFLYFLFSGALHFQLGYLATRHRDAPGSAAAAADRRAA